MLNPHQQRRRLKGDFCSRECVNEHLRPLASVVCLQCKRPFKKRPSQIEKSPNHFCGHHCAATYQNTHKTTGTKVSKLEQWLQARLVSLYPDIEFHFNRKDAIDSELDIYLPHLRLAFELNGIFHYEPIYGPDKLASIQGNDHRKFQACIEKKIELCLIDVSRMKNFKEARASQFLGIIRDVVGQRIVSAGRIELPWPPRQGGALPLG